MDCSDGCTTVYIYLKSNCTLKRGKLRGWPSGAVIMFTRSASAAQGSKVQILGMELHPPHQAKLRRHRTCKTEEDWQECYLRDNLPQAKRGRLATDFSSGTIFLTKKKKKRKEKKKGKLIRAVFFLSP